MAHVCVYDYVNHPFVRVASALLHDPKGVIQRATMVAGERAKDQDAQLHAEIGPFDVSVDVSIEIGPLDRTPVASGTEALRIPIVWQAIRRPELFPVMQAELRIYPLTSTETQLELAGTYEPRIGAFGKGVLHKIAEASVDQFVKELARYLREELREPSAAVVR